MMHVINLGILMSLNGGALMLGNTHHTHPTFAMALGVVAMEKIHTPEGQLTERSMINELSHLELKQQNPGGHD